MRSFRKVHRYSDIYGYQAASMVGSVKTQMEDTGLTPLTDRLPEEARCENESHLATPIRMTSGDVNQFTHSDEIRCVPRWDP